MGFGTNARFDSGLLFLPCYMALIWLIAPLNLHIHIRRVSNGTNRVLLFIVERI